jgi:hypothetical protein
MSLDPNGADREVVGAVQESAMVLRAHFHPSWVDWAAIIYPDLSALESHYYAQRNEVAVRVARDVRDQEKADLFVEGLISVEELQRNSEEEVDASITASQEEEEMAVDSEPVAPATVKGKGKAKAKASSPVERVSVVRSPVSRLASPFH